MALVSHVGRDCTNRQEDVTQVQQLLKARGLYFGSVDGICGVGTIGAIVEFQSDFLSKPDGRVDPNGETWNRLGKTSVSLAESDYEEAAKYLGCEVAAIKAVAEVESAGAGFLRDGRPRILFEGHCFHKYTEGAHSSSHATLSHPRQTNEFYSRGTPEQQGVGEHGRLAKAKELDVKAALLSCSVGKFQIMGFNHKLCGYSTVEAFWEALSLHERDQLRAFCAFVKAKKLVDHLVNHNWAGFAKGYNGAGYEKFSYDIKIANAYAKFSRA